MFLLIGMSQKLMAADKEALRIGMIQESDTLNPLLSSNSAGRYILGFLHRPFVSLDNDKEFKPLIVKKIPNLKDKSLKVFTTNKVKKIKATWEFVDGLRWNDNVPVTCKDLHFSWQVGLNPNVTLASKESFEKIEKIEWEEKTPTKCNVTYKEAHWNFFLNMPDLLPAHLEESIYNKYSSSKEGYERNSNYQREPTKKGLWFGPYIISEVKLGSHLILTANENFYGKKPKIKNIIIRYITSSASLESNLRSDTINHIARLGLSLDQALIFEKKIQAEKLPFEVKFQDGMTYAHININLTHSILKDQGVRQALSYGLNKQEIVDSLFEGKATIAYHLISPQDPLYTMDPTTINKYESDKKKARKILDDIGWKVGSDSFRYKEGQKLRFTLVAAGGAKINETIQTLIQSQWKEIGVDLKIKSETGRTLFSETLPKQKFDMALVSWASFPQESVSSVLNSKNIPSDSNMWAGQNYAGYKNERVDQLTDHYGSEFDFEKRKKNMREVMSLYTKEVPAIPLYFRKENSVVPVGMKNFELTGHLFFESLKSENWEL